MNSELLSSKSTAKRYIDFSKEKVNVVQTKRQRILSNNLLGRLTPKHYPCIFLDQRLRSNLFR